MDERQTRQRVLDFLDAFYAGDLLRTLDCFDDEIDIITYAPVELFPHLGHKHGKAWAGKLLSIRVLIDTFDLVEQALGRPINLPKIAS
jgi:hypothetical protein